MFLAGGTRWRSWLRHCAITWKVMGLIPDGVIGIFHWHNPSGRTVALRLTQPLTEMSTRKISRVVKGEGGRCVGLTNLPPLFADCLKVWYPQPPGTLRACPGLCNDYFTYVILIDELMVAVRKWYLISDWQQELWTRGVIGRKLLQETNK